MAQKSPESRYRIPSVSELLEMPAVRAVADRWNQSVAASGVRSFLDELRSDLRRRATEIHLPSVRELAERAARHVARLQRPAARPAINATGRLIDPNWIGRPLSEDALEQLVAYSTNYARSIGGDGRDSDAHHSAAATALARLTGAEAAAVVHSYGGAVWLTLAALAANKNCLVSRAETGDVEPERSIRALAESATAELREVGTANRTAAAEFEAAVTGNTTAILRHSSDNYHISGETNLPTWEELVGLARDRELPLVHAAGSAPLVDDLPAIGDLARSVSANIAAGVSLVVARGDGLVGGPPCGLIIGRRDLVARVENHPLSRMWQIDVLRAAALEATLDAYDDRERLPHVVPLFQLLTAPVENLRQRAERLAPQLAEAEMIQSAEAVATENPLGIAWSDAQDAGRIASYGIALTAAEGDARTLDERLRTAALPVVGCLEGDRVVLDLRTVFPRQDQRLVEIVAGRCVAADDSPEPVHAKN